MGTGGGPWGLGGSWSELSGDRRRRGVEQPGAQPALVGVAQQRRHQREQHRPGEDAGEAEGGHAADDAHQHQHGGDVGGAGDDQRPHHVVRAHHQDGAPQQEEEREPVGALREDRQHRRAPTPAPCPPPG